MTQRVHGAFRIVLGHRFARPNLRVVVVAIVMIVAVTVHRSVSIGAALGVERALDTAHLGAQPVHHVGDHVIVADVDDALTDLGGEVPVAEVPGDPRQLVRIGAADLEKRLGRRLDGNEGAILEPDAVARAQARRFGEIEQEGEPLRSGQHEAPPRTLVVVEPHDVGWLALPGPGG